MIEVDVVTFERYCSFSYGGYPVSKRKSDWISARIYYFPHHVTEYPDSTRVPENFWIFTRRILLGLDIYPRGSRVRPGLPTPKSDCRCRRGIALCARNFSYLHPPTIDEISKPMYLCHSKAFEACTVGIDAFLVADGKGVR